VRTGGVAIVSLSEKTSCRRFPTRASTDLFGGVARAGALDCLRQWHEDPVEWPRAALQ
jgi:hypothetical protein